MKKKKGFTLVELVVVIVIIGILCAVLIPSLVKYIDQAKDSNANIELKQISDSLYSSTLFEQNEENVILYAIIGGKTDNVDDFNIVDYTDHFYYFLSSNPETFDMEDIQYDKSEAVFNSDGKGETVFKCMFRDGVVLTLTFDVFDGGTTKYDYAVLKKLSFVNSSGGEAEKTYPN